MMVSCRTGRRARDQGFTLIEALVALAIGGVVIATLATITGQWLRGWRYGFANLQRSDLMVAGLDRIVADLSAARLMPIGNGAPGVIFAGESSSVTFVRRSLPVETPAGLELVRLAPLPGASDVTLARSRTVLPFGAPAPAPADPSPVVLLRPPFAVRFSYADAEAGWRPSWRARATVPLRVRVEVIDRTSGRALLAPVVVAIHVDAPGSCASVSSAKACDAAMGLGASPDVNAAASPPAAAGQL